MKVSVIQEFFEELNNHDWFYEFSDDFRVWQRGTQEEERLIKKADSDPQLLKMYKDFCKWTNNEIDKPKLENY